MVTSCVELPSKTCYWKKDRMDAKTRNKT